MAGRVDVFSQLAQLDAALMSVAATASSVKAQVAADMQEIGKAIDDATGSGGASKLDDFLFLLEQKVGEGHYLATVIKEFIGDVEDGVRRADEAARAFGDIHIEFEGKARLLGPLLQELLTDAAQTAAALRQGIVEAKDWQAALERLRGMQGQAAQSIVKMFEAFREGRVTLDFLLKTINDLKRLKPGDKANDLYQLLADAARTGDFT